MMNFEEYNNRLRDKDLQEFFEYLLMERVENPYDTAIKNTIAELQGLAMDGKLNGKTIIKLREQNSLAANLAEQGKIEESLAEIAQILETYPHYYAAFYTLGLISFEQENFSEAFDCFKQAIEFNPYFTDAVLRIFDCCVCLGKASDAGAFLSQALILQPNDPELLEAKKHVDSGTFPEHLAKYAKVEATEIPKSELLKLKEMLESGNAQEALEKLKVLV